MESSCDEEEETDFLAVVDQQRREDASADSAAHLFYTGGLTTARNTCKIYRLIGSVVFVPCYANFRTSDARIEVRFLFLL